MTSALLGGEWSASRPGLFIPGERGPGTHCMGGWMDSRAVLDDMEKRTFLTQLGLKLQPLHRPSRSQSFSPVGAYKFMLISVSQRSFKGRLVLFFFCIYTRTAKWLATGWTTVVQFPAGAWQMTTNPPCLYRSHGGKYHEQWEWLFSLLPLSSCLLSCVPPSLKRFSLSRVIVWLSVQIFLWTEWLGPAFPKVQVSASQGAVKLPSRRSP
jgi:hypothetical protein